MPCVCRGRRRSLSFPPSDLRFEIAGRRVSMSEKGPHVSGVLENALYVENVERSGAFYQRVFVFAVLFADPRLCALNVADRQVLLLFKQGASLEPISLPGGVIPPHDGEGQLHF